MNYLGSVQDVQRETVGDVRRAQHSTQRIRRVSKWSGEVAGSIDEYAGEGPEAVLFESGGGQEGGVQDSHWAARGNRDCFEGFDRRAGEDGGQCRGEDTARSGDA